MNKSYGLLTVNENLKDYLPNMLGKFSTRLTVAGLWLTCAAFSASTFAEGATNADSSGSDIVVIDELADSPEVLIQRMSEQAQLLEFEGLFTYERGAHSSSYRYFHQVDKGVERQRLVFLDGIRQELVNDGYAIKCIHVDEQSFFDLRASEVDKILTVRKDFSRVWQVYDGELLDQSRVADRLVKRVKLSPKDQHRYSYIFAVDAETGLMLNMQVFDQQDTLVEQFRYVMIEYRDVVDQDITQNLRQAAVKQYDLHIDHVGVKLAEQNDNLLQWDEYQLQLLWQPSGFQSTLKPTVKYQAMQSTFSDGLSSFSVFVEPMSEGDVRESADTQGMSMVNGGTAVATRFIATPSAQRLQLTVVGELPLATIKQIANNIMVR